jgi:hypothetical protein
MTVDIVGVTDRVRELLDYYTVGDEDKGEGLLIDLDAWSSSDLQEMIGLLTVVIRERGEDIRLDDVYEDTFEDWLERAIDSEPDVNCIESLWDEYVGDGHD